MRKCENSLQNLLRSHQNQQKYPVKNNNTCNCRGGPNKCPLGGKCLSESSVFYYCKVTRFDTKTSEFYTGLTLWSQLKLQTQATQEPNMFESTCLVAERFDLEWKIFDNSR